MCACGTNIHNISCVTLSIHVVTVIVNTIIGLLSHQFFVKFNIWGVCVGDGGGGGGPFKSGNMPSLSKYYKQLLIENIL